MANRQWTEARLEQDLKELHQLLERAHRESRGLPDDIVAQRLLKELIQRRRTQIQAFRTPVHTECIPGSFIASESGAVCRRV